MARSRNLSVEQFRDLMKNIPRSVADDLARSPLAQGERLASTMRAVAPRGKKDTHNLVDSIRVEKGRRPLQVLVKAGGPLTTKPVRDGARATYDYALANEFGTADMDAQPFFWPIYRLMKSSIRSALRKDARSALAKVVKIT